MRELARSPESRKINSDKVSKLHSEGCFKEAYKKSGLKNKGRKLSNELKSKLSIIALNNTYQRKCKSTKPYLCRDGSLVLMDSSWERRLACILDEMEVSWIRPPPIKYEDFKGVIHNYFPDFYLPDFNIYLEPKSEFVQRAQKDKMDWLSRNRKDVIVLSSIDEIENIRVYLTGLLNRR